MQKLHLKKGLFIQKFLSKKDGTKKKNKRYSPRMETRH